MARRNNIWASIDWLTVVVYLILVFLGWINIYAAVYNEEHQSIFDISQRYGKQLIWIGAALLLGFFILLIDTNFYVFFSWFFYGLVILLLVLVLVAGTEVNGSRSWFLIGGFQFQPSEFAKFATALALSKKMSSFNFRLSRKQSLLQVLAIILAPVVLIMFQPDTGSAIVFLSFVLVLYREGLSGVVLFFGALIVLLFLLSLLVPNYILLMVLFVGALVAHYVLNLRIRPVFRGLLIAAGVVSTLYAANRLLDAGFSNEVVVLAGTLACAVGFTVWIARLRIRRSYIVSLLFFASVLFTYSVDFVFQNVLEKHHQSRINELLGIQSDPLGAGYNVNQSKIAIGSGGFFGKGFLNGTQTKFNFVPEQSTDFIFCTVGEEWGFVGAGVVMALFIYLFIRLIMLAERQRSVFSRVYGYSVSIILFFHFVVNVGMTIGLMPVIGIPLPFFSYGGSSLWAFTILLFVFLRLDASRLDKLV